MFIYISGHFTQTSEIHSHTYWKSCRHINEMLLPAQLKSSLENLMNAFTKTWKIFHANLQAREFYLKCKVTEKIDCILKHGEVHLKLMCATFVHVCAVCSCHWTKKRLKTVTPILFKPLAFYLWIASPTSGNALCFFWGMHANSPALVDCLAKSL